jgi:hypothetical protein
MTVLGVLSLLLVVVSRPATGQGVGSLRVEIDAGPGPHFVGQGFELRLTVVESGEAPKIDAPRVRGAQIWVIGIEREPITTTSIGAIVSRESRFVIRLRVVAERPGTIDIPSILVQSETRTGRSRPLRLRIQPVPLDGRPAEFLGGVGRFVVSAEAEPSVVRVGQNLDFRIKVVGPAAWGMNQRPDLARFERLPLGLRIEAKEDETSNEPPSRTFVYRLRPTKSGEVTLPAVVVAAFDPALGRFITQAAPGVPIRVIAVPSLDLTAFEDDVSTGSAIGMKWVSLIARGLSAVLLLLSFAGLARVRRRLRRRSPVGPEAARRYAARLARRWGAHGLRAEPGHPSSLRGGAPGARRDNHDAAQRVCDELIRYLEIGVFRPPGALTPDEAREGIVRLTGSDELGSAASELVTRCDQVLYREVNGQAGTRELLDKAQGLFAALGRAKLRTARAT